MSAHIFPVVESFVGLVAKYKDWRSLTGLPEDELQILLTLLDAAGFKPKTIAPGRLEGDYRDMDGSRTGERFPINPSCPFIVFDEDGQDIRATGWLNAILSEACHRHRYLEDRWHTVEYVQDAVVESIPLPPIQLTAEGDFLAEYPPQKFVGGHMKDFHELGTCLHQYCGGYMDRIRATEQKNALSCRSCKLRVLFPRGIVTFGQLRDFFQEKIGKSVE